MKFIAIISVFLLMACQPNSRNANQSNRPKQNATEKSCFPEADLMSVQNIVGGQLVQQKDSDAKFVFLLRAQNQLCTAVAIGPNVVLTAAHCVTDSLENTYASFYTSLSCESGYNKNFHTINAEKVIIHEDYNRNLSPDEATADIALIFLKANIPEGYKIYKIAEQNDVKSDTELLIYGYGITGSKLGGRGILRKAKIAANNFFLDMGNRKVSIDQSGGTGICQGDSGGPSFVQVNGELKVLGISSYVVGTKDDICGDKSYQTLAHSYISWIESKIK